MQLIVNDYWRLALAAGCDFVHLGQADLEGADLQALRRAGVRVGVSTHDEAELERALGLAPDYVALGPIYHTTLKVMPWAPQGLQRIGVWKRRIGALPLVAIGGVTLERLPAGAGRGRGRRGGGVGHRARRRSGDARAAVAGGGGLEGSMNDRYQRQTVLPEVGAAGQRRLGDAAVLVVGAGGLGCALLPYLAAAGVGRLILVDHDRVEESNLHRQPLFRMSDVGRLKVEAARDALLATNPAGAHRGASRARSLPPTRPRSSPAWRSPSMRRTVSRQPTC